MVDHFKLEQLGWILVTVTEVTVSKANNVPLDLGPVQLYWMANYPANQARGTEKQFQGNSSSERLSHEIFLQFYSCQPAGGTAWISGQIIHRFDPNRVALDKYT